MTDLAKYHLDNGSAEVAPLKPHLYRFLEVLLDQCLFRDFDESLTETASNCVLALMCCSQVDHRVVSFKACWLTP